MGLFGWLSTWSTNRKVTQLEMQLQARPTPGLYVQLAAAYDEAGNPQKAYQVLKTGASRFPNAVELNKLYAEAEKREREAEKIRLQQRIQTHPNPILYARLAELYKLSGEMDKVISVCEAGIRAFPKYGGTYLVLGQIYLERKDLAQAREKLEKAIELDKYNYMALKLLAQVYMDLNMPAEAAKKLEDILYFAPGDEAILGLLKKAKESAGMAEPAEEAPAGAMPPGRGRAAAPSSGVPRGTTTITGRKTIVAAGRPAALGAPPAQAGRAVTARDRLLGEGIARLRAVEGVTGALLVDSYGLVVAAELDPSIDEGLAGALITNVYRTTSQNAQKMGVGAFEDGLIEGDGGNIHLLLLDDLILAVFASKTVRLGLLEKSIREFAAAVSGAR